MSYFEVSIVPEENPASPFWSCFHLAFTSYAIPLFTRAKKFLQSYGHIPVLHSKKFCRELTRGSLPFFLSQPLFPSDESMRRSPVSYVVALGAQTDQVVIIQRKIWMFFQFFDMMYFFCRPDLSFSSRKRCPRLCSISQSLSAVLAFVTIPHQDLHSLMFPRA